MLFGFLRHLFQSMPGTDMRPGKAVGLAFLGALWFVVHPVAVYGVAYLMQRSIVLATLFSLAALWCLLEGLLRRSPRWYAAAAVAYALALSSKEHAVMLPLVAAALVVLVRGPAGLPLRGLAAGIALSAALAAAVVARRWGLLGQAYEPFAGELLARAGIDPALAYALSIENQALLFFRYVGTWLLPWPGWISVDVRTAFPRELLGWHTAGFLAWLAVPFAAGAMLLRGGRIGLAGFALAFPWCLSLTELVAVRIQEPFVLYRSYLWMAGLPAALPALAASIPSRARVAAATTLVAILALAAQGRVGTFASQYALWDDAVRKNADMDAPYVERGYVARGFGHLDAGRYAEAEADFQRALAVRERYADAYLGRGTARLRTSRLAEALADFDRAIALDAKYASAHNQRCIAKAQLGRYREALADCEKAVALDAKDDTAWINAGALYRELGRTGEAEAAYRRALAIRPKSPSAHYNLGVLYLDQGRRDSAVLGHLALACEQGVADACDLVRRSRVRPRP